MMLVVCCCRVCVIQRFALRCVSALKLFCCRHASIFVKRNGKSDACHVDNVEILGTTRRGTTTSAAAVATQDDIDTANTNNANNNNNRGMNRLRWFGDFAGDYVPMTQGDIALIKERCAANQGEFPYLILFGF